MTKDWPDHLVIAVTERVPVLAVRMAGGGYDLVDPTGVIVRWARTPPAGLPLLVTSLPGGALRGAPSVAAAADVLAELSPWLARQVTEVSVTQARKRNAGDAGLRDGKTVLWGGAGQCRAEEPRARHPAAGRRALRRRERSGNRRHPVTPVM